MNKRLSYLPLEREGQVYWLAPNYLGKNTISDIKRLVEFFGLSDVFPEHNEQRLNELMKVLNRIYSIKGFASTDSAEAISHLHTLEQARSGTAQGMAYSQRQHQDTAEPLPAGQFFAAVGSWSGSKMNACVPTR